MLIEKLDGYLEAFDLDSKVDENGILIPKDEEDKKANTCPKLLSKDSYKSVEEYENTKKEILERYNVLATHFNKTIKKIVLNNTDELPTTNVVMKKIKEANDSVKGTEDYIKDTKYTLSKKESLEREAVREKAFDSFSSIYPLRLLANQLLQSAFKTKDRVMYSLFTVDVYSPEDVFRDFETLMNGTDIEKQDLINRKINVLKKTAIELSERKNSDEEYVDYFKTNFLNVQQLTEMDGTKIYDACKALNLPAPSGSAKEFVDNYGKQCNSIGGSMNIIGRCLNPYYSKLNDKSGPAIDLTDSTGYSVDFPLNRDIKDAFKSGDNIFDVLSCYKSDLILNRNNPELAIEDNLLFFFMKNQDYTKLVDSNGKEYTNDKESCKELAEKLLNGEKFVVYDKKGTYRTKMDFSNKDFNGTPSVSSKYVQDVNFKVDAAQSFKNIQNHMKKLNSIFSKDHDEYRRINNYIKNIDSHIKNGYSTSKICSDLRKLATDYVVSKAVNNKFDKTQRTLDREEFFTNLINNIDKAYPIKNLDPVVRNTKRIKDLDNADLTKDDYLNSIIKLNQDKNLSPEEIDRKAEEMLHEDLNNKQKIEIDLGDNKANNPKEPIIDGEAAVKEPPVNNMDM